MRGTYRNHECYGAGLRSATEGGERLWVKSSAAAYVLVVCGVLVAWAARTALDPHLGDIQPFGTFYIVVILAAWAFGMRPALVAAVLGWVVGTWFFLPPRQAFFGGGIQEAFATFVYLVVCGTVLGVTRRMHRTSRQVSTILRSITDAFLSLDRHWRFTYANPEAERLLRRSASDLRGVYIWDAFQDNGFFRSKYEQAMDTGQAIHFEAWYEPLEAWFEIHAYPGEEGLSIYFRNITSRIQTQAALRESEERFRLFMDNTPALAWVKDEQGRYVYLNKTYEQRFGVSLAEWRGKSDEELRDSETARRLRQADVAALAAKGPIEVTEETLEPDGRTSYWHNTKFSFSDVSGKRFIASLGLDITPRKRAEEALRDSEQRFRSFVEATNQAVWCTNARGEVQQSLPSWQAFTGQNDQAILGMGWLDAVHPDDRPRVLGAWDAVRATKGTYEIEYRLRRRDGQYRDVLVRGVPVLEANGHIREYIGTCIDVTEQRRMERELRMNEKRFRAIFEQAAIGIGIASLKDGRWMDVNEPFCRTLGYSPEFMRATPWPQITHPEDVEAALVQFRRMAAGEIDFYSLEKRFIHKDGHPIWARLSLSLVRDAQGKPDYQIAIVKNIDARKRAEQALLEREQKLRVALSAGRMGTWVWDVSTGTVVTDELHRQLWDIESKDSIVSADLVFSRVHPDDVARARAPAGAFEATSPFEMDFRIRRRNGEIRWLRSYGTLVPESKEGHRIIIGVNFDITEQKQAEEALRQSEQRFRMFFESDMFGALYWTADGRIQQYNDKFLRMLGYSREELQDRPLEWTKITPPEYRRVDEASLEEVCRHGVSTPYEKEFNRKDGSRIPVIIGAAAFDENRREGVAFVLDNSERKKAEASAAELRRKLDAGLMAGEVAIFEWNLVEDRLWGDSHFARFFELDLNENTTVPLATVTDRIHPDDRELVEECIQGTIQTGSPCEVEYRIVAGANVRWVVARGTVQKDEAGRPVRFAGALLDITARKQALDKLRASEERLRKAISTPTIGVLFFNLKGGISEANEAFTQMTGYTPEELKKINWRVLTAPESWDATVQKADGLANIGEVTPYEKEMIRKDGSRWWGLFAPIRLSGTGLESECMEFIVDITERRRAEEDLERRNYHLQILHHASAQLLVGQEPIELLRELHTEIARVFQADAFMVYQAENGNGQLHLLACGGVSKEEEQKLRTLRFGRAVCVKAAEAMKPIIATQLQTRDAPNHRFLKKLGFRSYLCYPLILNNRLHGTLAFASRQRDDYDTLDLDFFHTIADTLAAALERERLRAELQRHATNLERIVHDRTAQLRETVAELEGFSYSLVHDMRAPLRAMLAYADILEAEAGHRLTSEQIDLLRKLSISARRMDQLVTDSLNYSRIVLQELPLGPVNLGALLRGMVETYPNLQEPAASVTIDVGEVTVHGNEAALTQVFSNLLGNAVKFVAPGVHPRVRVWVELSQTDQKASARVYVQDNGIGIPTEAHEKIFGMFHRMHRAVDYPGTGIGLALVKKSLERTGGHVTLESEPGKGSRFCVELPLAAPQYALAE